MLGVGLPRAEFHRKLAARCSERVIEVAEGTDWPAAGTAASLSLQAAPD